MGVEAEGPINLTNGRKMITLPTERRNTLTMSGQHPLNIALSDNTVHALPIGTKLLFVQDRMAGDVYVEIGAERTAVSAVGKNRDAAFIAAVGRAQATA
jgi:hypothetical protein